MSSSGRVIRQEFPEDKSAKATSRKNTNGTVLVRAEEMLNIVSEWMRHSSGDLIIDESLCERLTKYTQYRKELDEAVQGLLSQELERYMIEEDDTNVFSCGLVNFAQANNKVFLTAEVFVDYDEDDWDDDDDDTTIFIPKLIRVQDFKRLLASMGNKIISYAYVREEYCDFFLWCKERGIDLKVKNPKSDELRTIQLILPEDIEKQNEKDSSSNVQ